jgi:hypothetical protein
VCVWSPALHKISAGERHTRKANLLQRSCHPIRVPSTPALAKPHPPIRRIARPPKPQLSSRYDSSTTHSRTPLPAALASAPFGFVLVRVRVLNALITLRSQRARASPSWLLSKPLHIYTFAHLRDARQWGYSARCGASRALHLRRPGARRRKRGEVTSPKRHRWVDVKKPCCG